jgi:hypothetical protein
MLSIAAFSCSTILYSHEAFHFENDRKIQKNDSGLKDLVIVSCSGKSGSTTLATSFQRIGIERYHCHNINNEMYEFILEREQDSNILLIDSIRDIISRKIASFFQNITNHIHLSKQEILASYKSNPSAFLRTLQEHFKKKMMPRKMRNAFKSWNQFNYNCITDGVFDFKKKYQLKKIGNLYFVNLRFDDIKNWEKIIKSIDLPMDLSHFKIVAANQAKDKWYRNIYQDFLANFTLTQAEFDKILSDKSEELAHFYTADEINDFIARWKPYIKDEG